MVHPAVCEHVKKSGFSLRRAKMLKEKEWLHISYPGPRWSRGCREQKTFTPEGVQDYGTFYFIIERVTVFVWKEHV